MFSPDFEMALAQLAFVQSYVQQLAKQIENRQEHRHDRDRSAFAAPQARPEHRRFWHRPAPAVKEPLQKERAVSAQHREMVMELAGS